MVFDGSLPDRPEILSSIQFSGNDATTNHFIAKFQQMYFSNELYYDWNKKNKAVKEFEPDEYIKYNDSVLHKAKKIYEEFIKEFSPNEKSKRWASFYVEDVYYDNIAFYAKDHRDTNDFGWDNSWTVPKGFYDKLEKRLPIHFLNLMNGYSLNSYANRFSYYVSEKMKAKRKEDANWHILPSGGLIVPADSYDSLSIYNILEYVPVILLKEIMLTQFFQNNFDKQDITSYEKYKDLIETHIQQPFLKEPLYQNYLHTKNRIKRPQLYTEAVLKNVNQSTVKDIFNEILEVNKDKVIYIDFWATWCGPLFK